MTTFLFIACAYALGWVGDHTTYHGPIQKWIMGFCVAGGILPFFISNHLYAALSLMSAIGCILWALSRPETTPIGKDKIEHGRM